MDVGEANHEDGSPSSPGAVATSTSPISSPALNQGGGTSTTSTTTPLSGAAPNTPSDSDERRATRTHRSSTDETHAKAPAVAPVKPAPIKAPSKSTLTTPIKSSSSSSGYFNAHFNTRHYITSSIFSHLFTSFLLLLATFSFNSNQNLFYSIFLPQFLTFFYVRTEQF